MTDIAAAANAVREAEGVSPAPVGQFTPPAQAAERPATQHAPAPAAEPAPVRAASVVIPLSEAQTNPAAAARPIESDSPTPDSDKPKRKGWFSRVLEN